MKKVYIVANFKSHKSRSEMEVWMEAFEDCINKHPVSDNVTVILAPPIPSIMFIANRLLAMPRNIVPGVQDISPFPEGAYTGAVSGRTLDGFRVRYAIIGHSERRQYFHEDDAMLMQKVVQANANSIEPIFCIQGKDTVIPERVSVVAYEPISAIGSGHPDTPEDANAVATYIKSNLSIQSVLYGGSVTPENVASFTSMEQIDGVLVGGASLDARTFAEIIKNA